jgi:site-specific recombinase XerD
MPRHARAYGLERRAARLKQPIARKPLFAKIGPGLSLGYRRNVGPGTWVVAVADGKGGRWTKAIGAADDFEDATGGSILSFWQAQDRARDLARGSQGEQGELVSVAHALDSYETDLQARGNGVENAGRVRLHLPDGLAHKTVALLTARDLRQWRDSLIGKGLAPASVNRILNGFRAALNLAADQDDRLNSRAWEKGLVALPDAQRSNNVILSEQAIRDLVAYAYQASTAFGRLVEAAAVTGARTSQLARLQIQDLQDHHLDPRLMMPASAKGRGQKKVQRRPVPIPKSLAVRLRCAAGDRPEDAILLLRPNGTPWTRSGHTHPFERLRDQAGLDKTVSIYALRHSSIVRQLLAGVPIRVVAVNHDTSVAMIEKNYSTFIADHSDGIARRGLLDLAVPPAGDNIVPLVPGKA